MARNVYVAIPAYTGSLRAETVGCLLAGLQELSASGIDSAVRFSIGDSILPRCRNAFVSDFYHRPEFTDLVFIDADVSWSQGALLQLLRHDADLVGGVYPKKVTPIEWPVMWNPGDELIVSEAGLIEVAGLPAGFLRITRACVERMIEAYPGLEYGESKGLNKRNWALFDFEHKAGTYTGEDYVFCRRFREAGGSVWLDPNISFGHVGSHAYTGCIGEEILKRTTVKAVEAA